MVLEVLDQLIALEMYVWFWHSKQFPYLPNSFPYSIKQKLKEKRKIIKKKGNIYSCVQHLILIIKEQTKSKKKT